MNRIRFSIRWLLLLTSFISVLLYVFYFRPTALAKDFFGVVKAEAGANIESVGKKYFGGSNWNGASLDQQLHPRSWLDVAKCRQNFSLNMVAPMGAKGEQLVATREYCSRLFGIFEVSEPALELREHRP